ncbi:hypothetical protein D9619_004435 [Psilocybe cf. subviscida]|uniref:Uncharacterized protein n=1 Tax=Psilocybe cf. subviscida TaxID=2480587 RepID=A0A8H5BPB8_9AGAR|nr:hypothetical protein D9619_004435 [Psilocybe cf. subviscida]
MYATTTRYAPNAENEHPSFGAAWTGATAVYNHTYASSYAYPHSHFGSPPVSPTSPSFGYSSHSVAGYTDHHRSPQGRRRSSSSARLAATVRHANGMHHVVSVGPDRHRPHGANGHNTLALPSPAKIRGPTNSAVIPQVSIPTPLTDNRVTARWDSIPFQLKGFPEAGVTVGTILGDSRHVLDGQDDLVFLPMDLSERWVTVVTKWKAYPNIHVNKRFETKKTTLLTLARELANALVSYADQVKKGRVPTVKGCEPWALAGSPSASNGGGIKVEDIFMTRLIHGVNGTWQVELWMPLKQSTMMVNFA